MSIKISTHKRQRIQNKTRLEPEIKTLKARK